MGKGIVIDNKVAWGREYALICESFCFAISFGLREYTKSGFSAEILTSSGVSKILIYNKREPLLELFFFVIRSCLASTFFVIRSCEQGDVVLLSVLSPLYNQVSKKLNVKDIDDGLYPWHEDGYW